MAAWLYYNRSVMMDSGIIRLKLYYDETNVVLFRIEYPYQKEDYEYDVEKYMINLYELVRGITNKEETEVKIIENIMRDYVIKG
jgi:hypothetical protein